MLSTNASIRAWMLSQAAITVSWLFVDVLDSQAYDKIHNLLQYYRLGMQAFRSNTIRITNYPAAI